jgi:hypothetical protein
MIVALEHTLLFSSEPVRANRYRVQRDGPLTHYPCRRLAVAHRHREPNRGWNICAQHGIIDVMRRSVRFRSLAAVLAFWFPLVTGEPGILATCPAHGATSAMLAHAPSDAGHGASHMHHAASQGGESRHHSAPGHNHKDCTCIGCCCAASGALRAPELPAVELAVVEYQVAPSVPSVESLPRPAPEFSRPYTTGPPRA